MLSLMFLDCFVQKLSKKNLWGFWLNLPPPLGKGRVKQTDAAAANLQISIQKDSRPSEFSRPLTSITLNLNRDLNVDRRRVSLLKLPIGSVSIQTYDVMVAG